MKLEINKIKTTPKNLPFNFCVWGDPTQEVMDWISYWSLKTEKFKGFTNIIIGDSNINELFEKPKIYDWVDGFSPNLNKHLHLGHLSNLVMAKSYQSLGVGKNYLAILGDTLSGSVSKEDALNKYNNYCDQFKYHIDDVLFASNQTLKDNSILFDGSGEYEGTKVFNINGQKIVGIKSNGSTSYFYQDVALAQQLNSSTLYITGFEQSQHFSLLKGLFPDISHIGLGLVTIDGKKMSSSEGNVITSEEVFNLIKNKFNDDYKLAWNVLCGFILKYDPESTKDIGIKSIDNVKSSFGLYLSYTLAKMKSAGMIPNKSDNFNSKSLEFKHLKSKITLSPNILFDELVNHCKFISQLYVKHHIKDNIENQKMYQPLLDDLLLGMKKLGMFDIDKV